MEALVLAAVLAFSLVIAVAGAWSALSLMIYVIEAGTALAELPDGNLITERAEQLATERGLLREPSVSARSLAA